VQLPDGVTESQFLEAAELAIAKLIPYFKHSFGLTVDVEDLRQMGMVFAIELMAKDTYDRSRPLANYIWQHIRNRTLNEIRDKVRRSDSPCKSCHGGIPCRPGGQVCTSYAKWQRRQRAKANLMKPERLVLDIHPDQAGITRANGVVDDVLGCELENLIDEELPVELRHDYLRMRHGEPVHQARREKVQRAVAQIIGREEPEPTLI
jgi:hypothetical protein